MIPLIPTLALALLSFISSAFIIFRIVIPILPPHPLSQRVPPSEFGLPNFRSLSTADKAHIWLAVCDILCLALFTWQVVQESLGGPHDFQVVSDPVSAVRFWLFLTLRQTLLLVVVFLTLLHVRMGRRVSFGSKLWVMWTPTLLLAITSTVIAGLLANLNVLSLLPGVVAYSTALVILSSAAMASLVVTLLIIRRNLATFKEPANPWPIKEEVEKPRPSFATEDIDALRDGSSWLTSNASSRHSVSAFSFSTRHSAKPSTASSIRVANPFAASQPSIPSKSSFWFNSSNAHRRDSDVPPVPRVPSVYRPASPTAASVTDDDDPFRRSLPNDTRVRLDSQNSWLTSPSASQVTLSAWSFPTTRPASPTDVHTDLLPANAVSRLETQAAASAQVLGGYGWDNQAEKGLADLSIVPTNDLDISLSRLIGWIVMIWVPFGLSLPYLFQISPTDSMTSMISPILFVLSLTLSSPLLAMNILLHSPLPIPSNLFDEHSEPLSFPMRHPFPVPTLARAHEYQRSGSITVVDEGRRSGDVWVKNGDAAESKTKLERAVGFLQPVPKLAMLPFEKEADDGELTPPLPMQEPEDEPSPVLRFQAQSIKSAERGHAYAQLDSKPSSSFTGAEESDSFQTRIMIAQRHYSTLATTMVLPSSPEEKGSTASRNMLSASTTGCVGTGRPSRLHEGSHLRSRSVSSVAVSNDSRAPPTPPPNAPLPPTPTTPGRNLVHHRCLESNGFLFSPVHSDADNINEIDGLSANLLPLLVPGLKVGPGMIVKDDVRKVTESSRSNDPAPKIQFGSISSFETPENHSTPAKLRTTPSHKRNHFSLPSLGLNRDGIHSLASWKADLTKALASNLKVVNSDVPESCRRRTMRGAESALTTFSHVKTVAESDELLRASSSGEDGKTQRSLTDRRVFDTLQPPTAHADVPSGVDTARSSLATLIAALDAELNPMAAASTATLLDHDSGPIAESTPQDHFRPVSSFALDNTLPSARRSSIVYIKSGGKAPDYAHTTRTPAYPARVATPLLSITSKMKKDRPSDGLKPFALLQERDPNRATTHELHGGTSLGSVRPLALGKKQRQDENYDSGSIKPLKLARSATAKVRGVLRQQEVLPDVVVRPPSTSPHTGFAYRFR